MEKTEGGFLISRLKQIQGRVFERLLSDSGVEEFNGAQGRILYVLWLKNGLPISEISRQTGLAKTTLTSMLDRLESGGLIKRQPSPTDRRLILIYLTPKAEGLQDKYNEVSLEMDRLFYKGFKDDEIAVFEAFLKRIINNLGNETK